MAYLWQISIVEFEKTSIIYGTILSGEPKLRKSGSTFNNMPATYFKAPLTNHPIKILAGSLQYDCLTSHTGDFYLECKTSDPIEVRIFSGNEELKPFQSYPSVFKNSESNLLAVSDIDDTLLVSYTASTWNRIRTILFTSPHKRKPINFTQKMLSAVQDNGGRVFYVSKSESNLFRLLTGVIQNLKLPYGNLFLTPYLRYNQLLKPKKGKDFKELSIKKILDNTTPKRIILIGDDTQQDIDVYTSIAEQYPDRIFKIYIRQTRRHFITKKRNQIAKLTNLAIPFCYFNDRDNVEAEIKLLQEFKKIKP